MRSVPKRVKIAVTATRECDVYDGSWYYEYLGELHRSGVLQDISSSLNREKIKNFLHAPTMEKFGFLLSCDKDKKWTVITPQEEKIIMGDVPGPWNKPFINIADTAESIVKFMLEMWGKNPRNQKYGTWLANAKRKVEAAVGMSCGGTQFVYPRDGDISVQVKQANSEMGVQVN